MDARIKRIIVDRALEKHEKLAAILRYLFVELAGVSQTKYYILGSYAIREHRTISDLDINMDHDEFFKLGALTDRGMGAVQIYGGAQIRWFFDLTQEYNALTGAAEADFSVEAFQKRPADGFPDASFSLQALKAARGLAVDPRFGHRFFSLPTLLRWKTAMNREKDRPDIELLNQLLLKPRSKAAKKPKRTR